MIRKYFRKYSLELVKEDECIYEGRIISSTDAYKKFIEIFKINKKAEEHIVMFCLNSKNEIIAAFLITKGGIDYSNINLTDIIKRTLLCNCKKIIIAHNHPSGDVTPSKEDLMFTEKMINACKFMGIDFLDHLVIGDKSFQSIKQKLF